MSADDDKLDEILAKADESVLNRIEEAIDVKASLDTAIFTAEVQDTLKNL
jgi:hypothetical protein